MRTNRSLCFKGTVKLRVDLDLGIYEPGDLVFVEGTQQWYALTGHGWINVAADHNVCMHRYEIGGYHGFKATHVDHRDMYCMQYSQRNSQEENSSQIPL